jgi:hypothetical protein
MALPRPPPATRLLLTAPLTLLATFAIPAIPRADPPQAPQGEAPAGSAATPAAPQTPAASRPTLVEVQGRVAAVDLARHRLTVTTAGGPVEMGLDRNTLVYGPAGGETVLALRPGSVVRAAHDAEGTAYWIQVRPPPARPAAPPVPDAPPAAPAPGDGATPRSGGA